MKASIRYAFIFLCLALSAALPTHAGLLDRLTKGFTGPEAQRKACDKGQAELCTSLGYSYRAGRDIEKDLDKAAEYFQRGCQGGDSKACHELYSMGFDYLHGKSGMAKDIERAMRLFRIGCDGGERSYSGSACHELAQSQLQDAAADGAVIMGLLDRACRGGSLGGCHELGEEYLRGEHTQQDVPGAIAALAKACEGENKIRAACATLGQTYNQGKLTARDITQAEHYLGEACSFPGWVGESCYALALLYDNELSGKKPAKDIADLYHIACHRADSGRVADACIAAAKMHETGRGVEKDDNWVNELYNFGCRLKHPQSCRLSCERACKRGQPYACDALKTNKIPLAATNCYSG